MPAHPTLPAAAGVLVLLVLLVALCSPAGAAGLGLGSWLRGERAVAAPQDYTCEECEAGTFANKTAQSPCHTLDPAGKCNTTDCPVPESGPTTCQSCSNITYQSLPGQNKCEFCPAGEIPAADRRSCVSCPAGNTSSASNHTCHPCERGTIRKLNGPGVCAECPDAQQPNVEHSDCVGCGPGTFSNPQTGGVCETCQQGWYTTDHTTCLSCNAGFQAVSPQEGPGSCRLCPKGYTWEMRTKTCPVPCKMGHYCVKGETGDGKEYCSACQNCPAGHYNFRTAQYACNACDTGTYAALPGAFKCTTCADGKFQTSTGQTSCEDCPAGFYCESKKASPLPCPSGKVCPRNSQKPQSCGTFYQASPTSCKMTFKLIAIIAGSCIGGISLLTLLVYVQYHQYSRASSEERAALIAKQQRADPVYNGF